MRSGRCLLLIISLSALCAPLEPAAAKQLNGRVEKEQDSIRLPRPGMPGAEPLNDSLEVRALGASAGMSLGTPLSAAAEDDVHKGGISTSDFQLPRQQPLRPQMAPMTTGYAPRDRSTDAYFSWVSDFSISPVPVYRAPGWGYNWAPEDWRYQYRVHRVRIAGDVYGTLTAQQAQGQLMSPVQPYVPPPPVQPLVIPVYSPPVMPQAAPQDELQTVVWDDWYKRVAKAIYANWSGMQKAGGQADVQLTVTRNRAISAKLISVQSDGPQFIRSLSAAVDRVNGSGVLDFPSPSRRTSVSFAATFKTGTNNCAGVNVSQVSDSECVRRH